MVFFILLLCASLPPSMISAELIGVARTTGPAQINGMSLPGQVNVFSGDRIGTGQDSTLTLSSGPQERVRLAAMSGAQVALEEGNLVISLEKGALGFESMGRTRITLKAYDVAGDRDSHAFQLLGLEEKRQVQRSRRDCPENQHSRGTGNHVPQYEVHGKHRTVIVRKQHHAEIPGDDGVGNYGNNQNDH